METILIKSLILQKGRAFKATFRVNAYDRKEVSNKACSLLFLQNSYWVFVSWLLQAFCTVDGLPAVVLINGADAQNRAVCSFGISFRITFAQCDDSFTLLCVDRK